MLAIVVPCFNEEKRLNVETWKGITRQFVNCHWFFVNDGSTDATSELLIQLIAPNVHYLDLPQNVGKGEAIRSGFHHILTRPPESLDGISARFSRIGYIDADGAFEASDLESVFAESSEKLETGSGFNILIASRVKLSGRDIKRNLHRHYLGRLISTFICIGWKSAPYDTQSGFKIFRLDSHFREAVRDPFITSWFFDIELILRLENLDASGVWEVPLMRWNEIENSSIKVSKYINVIQQIIRIRLLVRRQIKSWDS
jgi:dolichyl-phosphate beta-glucosyltransferase